MPTNDYHEFCDAHEANIEEWLWGDFSSFYSWFYEVIILESTNATDEGKLQVYF
jgi:hypothetical protein